jgi:hypothetical protein
LLSARLIPCPGQFCESCRPDQRLITVEWDADFSAWRDRTPRCALDASRCFPIWCVRRWPAVGRVERGRVSECWNPRDYASTTTAGGRSAYGGGPGMVHDRLLKRACRCARACPTAPVLLLSPQGDASIRSGAAVGWRPWCDFDLRALRRH